MRHEVAVWLYECTQSNCDDVLAALCVLVPFLLWLLALFLMPIGNGVPDKEKRK